MPESQEQTQTHQLKPHLLWFQRLDQRSASNIRLAKEYNEIYFFNIYIYLFIVLSHSCSTQDL